MDYDIEWLLEEIYSQKKEKSTKELRFLSDWNCYTHTDTAFSNLISDVFDYAKADSFNYTYAYDQFDLKEEIVELLSNTTSLSDENITFAPTATIGIGLAINAVKRLNLKRVLVFMPAYFSLIENLKSSGLQIVYYHLTTESNFSIDNLAIERVISEQFIDCVIITDPIYSNGIEISSQFYREIVELCNKKNCCLIVDYSLGGLNWQTETNELLPENKINILAECKLYCLIDSLPKRLFINGVKASILFGSIAFIDAVDRIAEGTYGAMNTLQIQLLRKLLQPSSLRAIQARIQSEIKKIRDNYNILKTVTQQQYELISSTCGTFTYMYHKVQSLDLVNTKSFAINLLREKNIIVLTNDRLGAISSNKFGIRINLSNETDMLVSSVLECDRIPLDSFNN